MPLYFFHTRNGGDYDDDDGTHFADDTAARAGARAGESPLTNRVGRG